MSKQRINWKNGLEDTIQIKEIEFSIEADPEEVEPLDEVLEARDDLIRKYGGD